MQVSDPLIIRSIYFAPVSSAAEKVACLFSNAPTKVWSSSALVRGEINNESTNVSFVHHESQPVHSASEKPERFYI